MIGFCGFGNIVAVVIGVGRAKSVTGFVDDRFVFLLPKRPFKP